MLTHFYTRSVTAAPDDHTAAQNLTNTAKEVRDDIKELLKAVDAAIPGKRVLLPTPHHNTTQLNTHPPPLSSLRT